MDHRLLHPFLRRLGDAGLDAMADHSPSVVASGLEAIQLISAARPVLGFPQLAGRGIERQALGIAMAVSPD